MQNNFQIETHRKFEEFGTDIQLEPFPIPNSGNGTAYKNFHSKTVFTIYHDRLDHENKTGIEIALGVDSIEEEYKIPSSEVVTWFDDIRSRIGRPAKEKPPMNWPRIGLRNPKEVQAFVEEFKLFLNKLPVRTTEIVAPHLSTEPADDFKAYDNNEGIHTSDVTSDIYEIMKDIALRDTEKRLLISARVGQGYFRDELIKYWGRCSLTGLTNVKLLRASHIKPWSKSSNQERLDPFNGLLLTPNIDLLFDKGFISIALDGELMTSSTLDKSELQIMGLPEGVKIEVVREHQLFLQFHREYVFQG